MSRKNKLENGIERLFSSSKPTITNGEPQVPPPSETSPVEAAAPIEPAPISEKKPAAAKPPRPRAKTTAAKPEPIKPQPPMVKEIAAETAPQGSMAEASTQPAAEKPVVDQTPAAEIAVEVSPIAIKDEAAAQPAVESPEAAVDAVQQVVEEKVAALVDELQYEDDEHLVIFRLNDQIYGVSIMVVDGIIKTQTITPVPRAPYSIVGVTNLRGIVLPVINMHQRLGLEELENSQHSRIIIINKTDVSAGLMVDEVLAVAKIDAKSITPPSPVINKTQTQFIKGIAKFDNRLVILLDLDKIFEAIATRTTSESFKRIEKV